MTVKTSAQERLQELHARLISSVEALVSGEDWQQMLRVAARFHRYSFYNQMLIMAQSPDAIRVAGFNTWRSLGRSVRKGEKGIAILAPCIYKKCLEDSNDADVEARVLRGFRVVHVFDVSQTDGEEIPEVLPRRLEGEVAQELWEGLAAQAKALGYRIITEPLGGRRNGYCDFGAKVIVIREGVSGAQALKTLVHEVAHATVHSPTYDRIAAEIEAESIAYIVCNVLGLDTDEYSFPYVASWSGGDIEKIKAAGERVVSTARGILSTLAVDSC